MVVDFLAHISKTLNSSLYNRILEFNKFTNTQSGLESKAVFSLSLDNRVMQFQGVKDNQMVISSFYHFIYFFFFKSSCLTKFQIREPLISTQSSARFLVSSEGIFLLHIITLSTRTVAENKVQGTPQILQLGQQKEIMKARSHIQRHVRAKVSIGH